MQLYTLRCYNCGSDRIRILKGEIICINCGCVLGRTYENSFFREDKSDNIRVHVRVSSKQHKLLDLGYKKLLFRVNPNRRIFFQNIT